MSSLKRTFSSFQSESKKSSVSLPGLKKVKLSGESNIKVYTRFRPISNEVYSDTYQVDILDSSVTINKPDDVITKNGGIKKFFFSEVFEPETTQEEITSQTCVPLIEDLFNNQKSSLLFTYGVTNAGKTHTIIGTKSDAGILPRSVRLILAACDQIMENVNQGTAQEFEIEELSGIKMGNLLTFQNHPEYKLTHIKAHLESFEIYNEEIYDLLADAKRDKVSGNLLRTKLQMKEGTDRRVIIKDLTSLEISTISQAESILDKCIANRSQADTLLNSNSSRSHTIFRIIIKFVYQSSANSIFTESSLCVVDLAGSERAKRTENAGNQMVEACNINKSLLVLGRCLKALKEHQTGAGSNSVVPYRETKLTRILYEYFHEENNLRMIANINPRQVDFEESMRVLNYAAIAKDIQPIKSRIDNTRKNFFPIARQDLQYSRTEDNMSNFLTEDSLIDFKGLFDDKENSNDNRKGGGESIPKRLLANQPDEKDLLIKVLEEKLFQAQHNNMILQIKNNLQRTNESFNQQMKSLLSNDQHSYSKTLDSFTLDSANLPTMGDYKSLNLQSSFSERQNVFSYEPKSLNVNFFLFSEPLDQKKVQVLQKAFDVKNTQIHQQIYNISPEMVRKEIKEQEDTLNSTEFTEKPEKCLIEESKALEKVFEEEIPSENLSEILVNKEESKKPKRNKVQRKVGKTGPEMGEEKNEPTLLVSTEPIEKSETTLVQEKEVIEKAVVEEKNPEYEVEDVEDNKGKKKKNIKKQNKKPAKERNKKEHSSKETHENDISELTGYEALATPEIIKLTLQLDEDPDFKIPKKQRGKKHAHVEPEVPQNQELEKEKEDLEKEIEVDPSKLITPICKRTRKKNKK